MVGIGEMGDKVYPGELRVSANGVIRELSDFVSDEINLKRLAAGRGKKLGYEIGIGEYFYRLVDKRDEVLVYERGDRVEK